MSSTKKSKLPHEKIALERMDELFRLNTILRLEGEYPKRLGSDASRSEQASGKQVIKAVQNWTRNRHKDWEMLVRPENLPERDWEAKPSKRMAAEGRRWDTRTHLDEVATGLDWYHLMCPVDELGKSARNKVVHRFEREVSTLNTIIRRRDLRMKVKPSR